MIQIAAILLFVSFTLFSPRTSLAFWGSDDTVTNLKEAFEIAKIPSKNDITWTDDIDFSVDAYNRELNDNKIIISAITGTQEGLDKHTCMGELLKTFINETKKTYRLNNKTSALNSIDFDSSRFYIVKTAAMYNKPLSSFTKRILLDPATIRNMVKFDEVRPLKTTSLDDQSDLILQPYVASTRKIGTNFNIDLNLSYLRAKTPLYNNLRSEYFSPVFDNLIFVSIATSFAAILESVFNVCQFTAQDENKTLEICYAVASKNNGFLSRTINMDPGVIATAVAPVNYLRNYLR